MKLLKSPKFQEFFRTVFGLSIIGLYTFWFWNNLVPSMRCS